MTEQIKIEPCPFCGDPMEVRHETLRHALFGRCIIEAYTWDESRVALWNARSKPKEEVFCLTNAEQKAQASRCPCGGSDDYCPCQNVPDRVTIGERKANASQD